MGKDWNIAYEIGDTPWDKGYASPPLEAFLEQHSVSGRVIVPGCGTGHDVRLFAARAAATIGMDIAPGAIRKAEAFPPAGTERYELGDFLQLGPHHHGVYDWVVEHTCLCAIDPVERESYVAAVRQSLKPGGQFLAVFFREISDSTGGGPPYPISRQETDALFGEGFELVESWIPERSYPSRPTGAEELCWWRLK